MPKLLLKFEASVIKEIKLDKPGYTVGRKPDNDIVLDNSAVSGHHCKIFETANVWYVEDLRSTNGTLLNGARVLKAGLHNNDSVSIVKYSLVFMEDSAADAVRPAAPAGVELPQQKNWVEGRLEVMEGGCEEKTEYELTKLSTYIGKTPRTDIQYKGTGVFNAGPDIAVAITSSLEGYCLVPIKEGYTRHNGNPLNEKVFLKDDDIIVIGMTKFRFFIKK